MEVFQKNYLNSFRFHNFEKTVGNMDKQAKDRNLSFLKAINLVFYVNKLFGSIPHSLSVYFEKNKLAFSLLGNIHTVIGVVVYTYLFHITIHPTLFNAFALKEGKTFYSACEYNNFIHSRIDISFSKTKRHSP